MAAAGRPVADFPYEDGVQQGDAFASAGFCVGVHPEARALGAELWEHGGAAQLDVDDGCAVRPASAVFPAVERFAGHVAELGARPPAQRACTVSRLRSKSSIPGCPAAAQNCEAEVGYVNLISGKAAR